jgi:hypothetical protein
MQSKLDKTTPQSLIHGISQQEALLLQRTGGVGVQVVDIVLIQDAICCCDYDAHCIVVSFIPFPTTAIPAGRMYCTDRWYTLQSHHTHFCSHDLLCWCKTCRCCKKTRKSTRHTLPLKPKARAVPASYLAGQSDGGDAAWRVHHIRHGRGKYIRQDARSS